MIDKIINLFKIQELLKFHNIQPMELDKFKSHVIVKMGETAMTDGSVIMWNGDGELMENTPVMIKQSEGEPTPVPDGTYTLENGDTIVCVSSVVTEIVKAEPAQAPEEPEMKAPEANINESISPSQAKEIIESITKTTKFQSELETKLSEQSKEITALKEANKTLLTLVEEMSKKSSSEPAKPVTSMFTTHKETKDVNSEILRVANLLK